VEFVDQHRDAAVVLGTRHPPRVMLARDEAALPVTGIAVGEIGWTAIDADTCRAFVPAHDPVVGNIAPEEAACIAEIDGPLTPAHARGEPLHARVGDAIFGK